MKSKAATSLIVTMLLTASGYANPPPVTYRLSNFGHSVIFGRGFTAAGQNYDLLSFLSGESTAADTSGYLVSTSSLSEAIDILRRRVRTHPTDQYYLYTIRPTSNFYNVARSLDYARHNLPDSPARVQANTLWLSTNWNRQEHWATRDRIRPEQILGGQEISLDGHVVRFGEYVQNAAYEYTAPLVSRYLMPIRNNTVGEAYVTEEDTGIGFVPASLDNMVCEASQQRSAAQRADKCLTTMKLTFRQLWTRAIAKMMATGIVSGSTTNQLLAEPGHDEI